MLGLLALEGLWGLGVFLLARKLGRRPCPKTVALAFSSALPTIVAATWGIAFAVEPASISTIARPAWIVDSLWYFFYASIALTVVAPLLAKGYRIPAVMFALPQAPLTWFFGFVGTMQITGVWL